MISADVGLLQIENSPLGLTVTVTMTVNELMNIQYHLKNVPVTVTVTVTRTVNELMNIQYHIKDVPVTVTVAVKREVNELIDCYSVFYYESTSDSDKNSQRTY